MDRSRLELPKVARLRAELDRTRRDLDRVRGERDRARERVRRLRGRDDLGYLFVLTYGRSGSTLLQGILNSIPGYLVRGENRQVLRHLYRFHTEAGLARAEQQRRQRKWDGPIGQANPTNPWFGIEDYPPARALREIRRLALATLLRPEDDTRVSGFKEIRWEEDTAEYVAWLRQVFPGARFVVNTRDLDAVAQSKWWAARPDAHGHLADLEGRLLAVADGLGPDAFRVHYDDYVADPGALRGLFDWLGEELDVARVRAVLDVPHSY